MVALLLVFGVAVAALRIYVNVAEDSRGYNWLLLLSLIQVTPFVVGMILKSQNYINFIFISHFVGFSVAKYNEIEIITKNRALSMSWINATKELLICTIIMFVAFHVAHRALIPAEMRRRYFSDITLQPNHVMWIMIYVIMIPWLPNLLPYSLLIIHYAMSSAQVLLVVCAECPKNPTMLFWARAAIPVVSMFSFMQWGF